MGFTFDLDEDRQLMVPAVNDTMAGMTQSEVWHAVYPS